MLKQKSRWSSGKTLASHTNSPRFESRLGQCRYGSCVLLAKVAPRPSDETFNQGLVCVRMHLSSCTDLIEPG